MALEIERKWLVSNTPELVETLKEKRLPFLNIAQGYVFSNKTSSVRIRSSVEIGHHKGGISMTRAKGFITLKKNVGVSLVKRKEYEYSIPYKDATEIIRDLEAILKDRYVITLDNGLVLELDFFEDKLDGLVIAEIEFPDENSASKEIVLPQWLPVIREVTEDPRFLNCNLVGKCYNDICS